MIQIETLTKNTLEKIKSYRFDRIIEKHEGPEQWDSVIKYYDPEFMEISGKAVLLPVEREQHKNITILRVITDKEDKSLTVFLKDITYVDNSEDEFFSAGFVAICERVKGEEFYIAILYHEWFIIDEHFTAQT